MTPEFLRVHLSVDLGKIRPHFLPCAVNNPIGIPLEINPILETIKDLKARTDVLRGYL